jgi:hypothetical protein
MTIDRRAKPESTSKKDGSDMDRSHYKIFSTGAITGGFPVK